jgi:hypothetical protein
MRPFWVAGQLCAVMLLVSACGTIPVPAGYSAAFTCQREVGAFGTYRVPKGVDVPVVEPVEDGTKAGADAINACIRAKAAQGTIGGASLPGVAGVPQSVSTTEVSGSRVTKTYTYGTPPVAASAPGGVRSVASAGRGKCRLQMTGGTGYMCVTK